MAIKLTRYVEYLLEDVFIQLDGVEVKRMFGGYSYYLGGYIFAFSGPDDGLMFKTNDETRKKYQDKGSEQFIYDGHKNKAAVYMPYWTVPEEIIEDPTLLAEWANEAASISRKAA